MKYRLFWEEITEESAREGDVSDMGIVSWDWNFVSMRNICGKEAEKVLDENTFVFGANSRHDVFLALQDIVDEIGGIDHFERFMNEFMVYGLNGALNEKVIRSAWIKDEKYANVVEDFLNQYWS